MIDDDYPDMRKSLVAIFDAPKCGYMRQGVMPTCVSGGVILFTESPPKYRGKDNQRHAPLNPLYTFVLGQRIQT